MKPTLLQIDQLAQTVGGLIAAEPAEAGHALAWLARNLVEAKGLSFSETCLSLEDLGLRAAGARRRRADANHPCDPGFCRALSLVSGAWAGEGGDPTGGAVFAHRHDQNPIWARRAEPTALIGSWIFYRPR